MNINYKTKIHYKRTTTKQLKKHGHTPRQITVLADISEPCPSSMGFSKKTGILF